MLCAIAISTLFAVPVRAQDRSATPGQIAESSVGVAGRRTTSEDVSPIVRPARRIDRRIANRVQTRIRNRIDRNYDPRANTTSPFELAAEEVEAPSAAPR